MPLTVTEPVPPAGVAIAKAASGSLGVTGAAMVAPTGGGTAVDDNAENTAEPGMELPQPANNSAQAESTAVRVF